MIMKSCAFVCLVAGAGSMRTGASWWDAERTKDYSITDDGNRIQYKITPNCENETWSIATGEVTDNAGNHPLMEDTVLHLIGTSGQILGFDDDHDTENGHYRTPAESDYYSNLTYDAGPEKPVLYVVVRQYQLDEYHRGVLSMKFQCRSPTHSPECCKMDPVSLERVTKFPKPGLKTPYTWGSLITWHVPDFGAATMKFPALCAGQKFEFNVSSAQSVLSDPMVTIFNNSGVNVSHADDLGYDTAAGLSAHLTFVAPARGYYYMTVDGHHVNDTGHFNLVTSCDASVCACHPWLEAQNFKFTQGPFNTLPYQTIKDDPELVNLMGQKVSLYGSGTYTLVDVPRASAAPTLRILAGVQPLKNNICDTFITTLDITGTSVGNAGLVSVHAGNSTHEFAMRFGSDDWMPLSELKYDDGTVRARKNKQSFQVVLDIGDVHIKIAKPHVARGRNWNWLNLFISGLQSFDAPIGGVLGLDVPSQDHPCHTKGRRKFIKQK